MLDVFETQLIIDKNLRNVHVIAQEQRLDPTVEPNGQLLFFRAYYGDLRATH